MISVKKKLASIGVAAAAVCMLALAGCGSGNGLTGGVAATVNGNDIPEDKVTTYIMDLRDAQTITSDRDWANWLNNNGYTPETLREAVINMFVTQELEKEAAAENGIEVTDDEVNAIVESMKSNYDTDEAWQSALSSAGLTEESYRENVYQPMLEEKLLDAVISDDDKKADDDTVLSYVALYAPSLDGMKRSSHILFAADDEATAQQVLNQINAGADFATLAQQYSTDTGSAQNGGDVGWDGLNSFVSAYTDALNGLDAGQVSGLVTSEYGIHIIKCTEVFHAPEEITSLDQVPSALVDVIRTQMADPAAEQTAYSNYIQGLRDAADIHINDMPGNVPYNVDMDKYVSSSTSEEATDDSGEGEDEAEAVVDDESDGEAEDEAAEDDAEAEDAAADGDEADDDGASGEDGSSSSSGSSGN